VSVLPVFKLLERHPEPDWLRNTLNSDLLKHDIRTSGAELSSRVAHRSRAIAATTGLVEHQWAIALIERSQQLPSFLSEINSGW